MSHFPSKQELAVLIRDCEAAREASKDATGLEKLQLIYKAFPYAITGGDAGALRINWHPTAKGWTICDTAGFITILPTDDLPGLCVMLGMEAGKAGSVRELITGQKRAEARKSTPPIPEHKPARKLPKGKISLADIGLGGKNDEGN